MSFLEDSEEVVHALSKLVAEAQTMIAGICVMKANRNSSSTPTGEFRNLNETHSTCWANYARVAKGLRTISESHAGPSTSGGLAEPTVTQDELRLAQSHVSHKHTNNNAQSPTSKSNNSTVSVNKEFGDNVPSAGALTIISPVEKAEVSPVPGSSTIPCVTGKDQGANAVQRSIHRPSDSPSCRAGIAGQSSKLNSGSSTRSNIKEEDLLGNPRAIAGGLKQASKPVGLSKVKPVNENKSSTLAKTKQVGSPAQAEAEESARSTKLSESTGGDKTISSNLEPKNADIEHGPQHIDANVQPAKTAQAVVIANHCLFNVNGHVCPNQIQGLKLHLCNSEIRLDSKARNLCKCGGQYARPGTNAGDGYAYEGVR